MKRVEHLRVTELHESIDAAILLLRAGDEPHRFVLSRAQAIQLGMLLLQAGTGAFALRTQGVWCDEQRQLELLLAAEREA